ncbi:MAG: glycoside hydrolase family 3 C-terminal domain-containing protein, partial [Candidatus Cryptobacteroides sp.]
MRPEMIWQRWVDAGMTNDSCMAYPSLICLASTWNPEMARLMGDNYSREVIFRNKNVILGPGVNIFRSPMNGRNFEYMGEDPFLASKIAVGYIQGVQSNNVAACVKHFAVNNQEYKRMSVNSVVDERTMNEIYFPAFKAAVKEGKVWAVMGAYNKYNGQHCSHNSYLLNEILKGEWGFDGVVISDFGGTHNTLEAITNGLDIEMGTRLGSAEAFRSYHLADAYLKLLKEGKADMEVLDDKVRRVLRMMFRTSMSGKQPWGELASERQMAASRRIAEEGIVLLKNDGGILPLNPDSGEKILIVGENAKRMMTREGGSSEVKSKYEILPYDGIVSAAGSHANIFWQPGYSSSASPVVCDSLRNEAVKAAAEADVVIYVGGLNKERGNDSEGADRKSFNLPYSQDELISALSARCKKMVTVIVSGGTYSMPWEAEVPAMLQMWYGGSEAGNALASVLFGEVNPSGHLPVSFHKKLEDCAAHSIGEFPGDGNTVEYKEGIYVGYRWLEKESIKPQFAFGHGLSYTDFKYGNLKLDKTKFTEDETITVTLTVTNVGKMAGADVVQLYVNDEKSSLPRPVKELKGFSKVYLEPGECKEVAFTLDSSSFSFYNPEKHKWMAEPGRFNILVGKSSDKIEKKATVIL